MSEEANWSVQPSRAAARAVRALPETVAAAVVEFITVTLPSNPRQLSKALRYELEGWHVARRGDYRVIFQILEDDKVLLTGRVEHRSQAYRPR